MIKVKMIELAKVPAEKSVEAFGKKFTVLEHTDDGVLVLSDTVETEMAFRENPVEHVAPNNFSYSDVYRYLNGEYLNELIENGADENCDILAINIDLKCTLGQREYGFCNTDVGLLTLEQYGKYFDIIPKVDCGWWLSTPYGTPLRSPLASSTYADFT